MSKRSAWVARPPALEREERELAGRISGLLCVLLGLTLAALTALPEGITRAHPGILYGCAAGACLWGLAQAHAIDFNRVPWWLIHVSNLASLMLIAVIVHASGGDRSPAWVYLFILVVPTAYFYRPWVAAAYLAGCVLTHAGVLLYDPAALHQYFLRQLAIAVACYLALGAATLAVKRLMRTLRRRAEDLAAEQGALRRVATAVVGGGSAPDFYELVAREAGALLGASAAGILRLDDSAKATVMGSWAERPGGRYPPATVVAIPPGSEIAELIKTRQPVRTVDHEPDSPIMRLGYRCSIVTPILVAERVWGVLAATAPAAGGLDADDERRLTEFADLLALAITSIEDRAKLSAQALTDPLTGLANHRSLRERLVAELARAERHSLPLSVAVIDVDNLKQINDQGGHEAGDEILIWVATCLAGQRRTEDTLARVGGDEFIWLLPQTTREDALAAVERARLGIAASDAPAPPVTVSAGICDTGSVVDPAELIRFADRALYRSKACGRDQVRLYDGAEAAEGELAPS